MSSPFALLTAIGAMAGAAVLSVGVAALCATKEDEALALAKKAIDDDYLGTRFADAEKKLEQALAVCEPEGACSAKVRAQILCELAVVYIGGMKREGDGKARFIDALKVDPNVVPEADLTSPEIEAAFAEAKRAAEPAPPPPPPKGAGEIAPKPPEPPPGPDSGDCPPDFPGCHGKTHGPPPCDPTAPDAACAEDAQPKARKNWLSLAVEQDFLFMSGSNATCAGGNAYSCFDDKGTYYSGIPYAMSGDVVRGGISPATTRVLAGYDRVIVAGLALGVRLGYAFRGGPTAPGGRAFLPVHGEVRVSYWFGKGPFRRTGVRPYVVAGGGLAEVDASVNAILYENKQDYISDTRTTFAAWQKAGTGFIAGGVGLMIAPTPRMGPFLELKLMELLGASAPALNLQLGYALGL